MLQFYVVDNLWQGTLNTAHFHCLPDAVRAYRELPAANRKALGVQRGVEAIDLVQCLPLSSSQAPYPSLPGNARKLTHCAAPPLPTGTASLGSRGGPFADREGEDVMVLRFLEYPLWKSDPQIMEAAQELASRLHIRYCLFRRCIIPVPDRDKLPRPLRGRYLWPDEPGDFATAAQWIYVAGAGRLSALEFKRRYFVGAGSVSLTPPQAGEFVPSAAPPLPTKPDGRLCGDPFSNSVQYPLVVHIGAHGMDSRGNYKALQVTPWEFRLLIQRSKERVDQNKKETRNVK